MANKKISDFSAVKDADVSNMTAIAGVGTDGQNQANQNVKISGAELINSLNIPTNNNELTNGANYITAASLPTVNDGTLTIAYGSTQVGTFTANAADDTTITIPAAGGGGIDFSNIIITGPGNIKADLTQSSQAQYGQAITVKANGAISNGDIVVSDYSGGQVRGLKPTTLPTQNTITGVAIEDIADGQSGKVLVYGYATANYRQYVPPSSAAPNLELDSVSNGNTLVLTPGVLQPFSDSGGPGSSNYSSNQTYSHTFDAGAGAVVNLTIKSFQFEGVGSSAWDRLGFQESDDDVTYVNCKFSPGQGSSDNTGWRRMSNPMSWQSGSSGASVASGPYNDGYVLPGDNTGGAFILPLTVSTTKRYLKVFFYSDFGTERDGWEIDLSTSAQVASPNSALGGFVYLDVTDVARGTNQTGTGRLLGITTGGTTTDSSTIIFVEPPRVT